MFANNMTMRIANTIAPLVSKSVGPGRKPCIMNAPSNKAVTLSPGIPSVSRGTIVGPLTALLAASAAATPSISPLPNLSGCFDAFFAAI